MFKLFLCQSPFCDQQQSANVAIMRLGRVACFSDVCYPILRHIVANMGDNLQRTCFWQTNHEMAKKNRKKSYFLIFNAS